MLLFWPEVENVFDWNSAVRQFFRQSAAVREGWISVSRHFGGTTVTGVAAFHHPAVGRNPDILSGPDCLQFPRPNPDRNLDRVSGFGGKTLCGRRIATKIATWRHDSKPTCSNAGESRRSINHELD
jgi:hypothetical protein